MDECNSTTFPCGDNANCTDTDGSFKCDCLIGFQGDGFNCTGMYIIGCYMTPELCLHQVNECPLIATICAQILTNVKNLLIRVHVMLLVQTLWEATSVLAILVLLEMGPLAVSALLNLCFDIHVG